MAASSAGRTGRPPVQRAARRPAVARVVRDNPVRTLVTRARKAWDRPLTAYYVLAGGSALILVLGLVMVYSASQVTALQKALPGSYFFRKQLLAAAIGTVLLLVAARMPVKLHRALAYPILAGAVFLMALVQVPGIGVSVNGNQNWISLGGSFQIQPSEIGKLALVLWGADLIARKQEKRLLTQWKHMLVPLVPVAFMLLGLIMLGGDMGTAIILTGILFGLLWLAGAPTRLFVGVLSIASLIGLVLIKTSPNRLDRFACVGSDDVTKCWQAVHGIYALASGGLFGSGLGASVEKWGQLPEAHTDFIFAITGEELGLAGTLSVLALFAALGYAGIRVAGRTEDPFVRYAAGGVTTWITVQAVINIGAVLGLLPIAGVPLPLFSYGGSALLPTMFAIGLLIAFARDEPAARAALAMRQPRFGRKRTSGSAAGRTTGRKPGRGSGRTPGRASARASGGSSGRGTGQGSGQGPRRWNTMRRRASAARPSGER
ncbi:cell division protein FtsW [Streptomyces thermoviolaceus subsp. thermoviolaceus]|uniref:Probable peptidoglycan glycosyltransferase FtsW n=3 Tax=Streptomyces thermoviolaceus TaxID=1952 RepID=A0ABX0YY20_STRTL|nr:MULTISPECIES: putative lipid II flippase FtsW [Streptomyces]WTD49593.1 putative lipid II flippase FtsW [Streptomyces thermoviolaceus]NJP16784.1 putative lipid II flippase FtsW [Streptomyces thermoviolaceus subsp. thermoviolaceus]RSS05244.1 putative lipid II flippase FtsW [Streptomyces sp. WAC00469]GGV61996.1 cell division protein FtsW [Streptomyces thermoviolaceus subsp. apingens]GHA79078.1 cell division protein FtsW [Streptomyces thermoviolaceus subsp. thermoviolaceus]